MSQMKQFLQDLSTALKENRVTLPTLPEVALKVRDALDREFISATELAEIIATDAAISARLLQVANSPLYRTRSEIDSVQMAVTRMGLKTVRTLVNSLAMRQMFQATSDLLDQRFRQLWQESTDIAALCRVLAANTPHLEREQAMLAGLIHNIGALPILSFVEQEGGELSENPDLLDSYLERLSPVVGRSILTSWKFPEALINVAANCRNLSYDGGPMADYVDLVLVSRLELVPEAQPAIDRAAIPSFAKLGLDHEVEIIELEGVAEEYQEVKSCLM